MSCSHDRWNRAPLARLPVPWRDRMARAADVALAILFLAACTAILAGTVWAVVLWMRRT